MAATRRGKALTEAQVRRLPWPKKLLVGEPLTSDECYEVGRIVVEKVWGGQFDRARGRKAWSVRRLCEVLGGASAATMTRYVQVYEVAQDLNLKRPLGNVPVSTLFSVAGLPVATRKKVARKALNERWSKQRVQQEVRKRLPERFGRPPSPGFIKALNACSKTELLEDMESISKLSPSKINDAIKRVDALQKTLDKLKKTLQKQARARTRRK